MGQGQSGNRGGGGQEVGNCIKPQSPTPNEVLPPARVDFLKACSDTLSLHFRIEAPRWRRCTHSVTAPDREVKTVRNSGQVFILEARANGLCGLTESNCGTESKRCHSMGPKSDESWKPSCSVLNEKLVESLFTTCSFKVCK